jgi:hypothetical protein
LSTSTVFILLAKLSWQGKEAAKQAASSKQQAAGSRHQRRRERGRGGKKADVIPSHPFPFPFSFLIDFSPCCHHYFLVFVY